MQQRVYPVNDMSKGYNGISTCAILLGGGRFMLYAQYARGDYGPSMSSMRAEFLSYNKIHLKLMATCLKMG